MHPEYRSLRLQQLASSLAAFYEARNIPRPQRGWLRAVREALGLTLEQIGRSISTGRANVQFFENAEANDKITLHSLRRVAEAMGCELVYAIVPKSGTIQELAERRARAEAAKHVNAVEHSMMLEDQASGNTEQLIDEETKRSRKKA
jgi:predicted DNA-binding mobile mystery protein A